MTISQAEIFYEQDTKKYDISKNKELLTWLKEATKNGYSSFFIDIEHLQDLIDNIVSWYETKYPEREMELYEGIRYISFENIETLSNVMDIKQLMYRLPHKQLCLMECNYRSNGGGIRDVYNDKGEVVGQKTIVFMEIDRKDIKESYPTSGKLPNFLLYADTDNGQVYVDYNLKDYVNVNNITLDELLILFKEKYTNKLEFSTLEKCIYNHNCDIELRRRVLQLVALKLLYSDKTTPRRGYKRAKNFINEFNKEMNLNLTTDEIDEIINRDYNKPLKKPKKLVKSLFSKK